MVVNRRCSLRKLSMWDSNRSALQTLHKVSSKAREQNYFQGGLTHTWVNYYEQKIESDRSCLNEWHAMDNLESRRPPSPDSVRTKPTKREETEKVIKATLKEIMMSVDLDEVTSKYIRSRLEEDLDMDLGEYKSFIDQEMLTILGQMDAPTEIFEHVYLGSEWNASNYEELQRNGVGHILNVTREIDNFFPGTFDYLNIRVYDDEKTDLLKFWDDTFKYISKARNEGSKVLVHCKMGVSRSASVVIAYAMKAYNWDFKRAMQHVKEKRSCIKPNTSFIEQLETYQGILDAMKNKEKLQRSKSETNLKCSDSVVKNKDAGAEPTPVAQVLTESGLQTTRSGQDLRNAGTRPKSWSPNNTATNILLTEIKAPPVFRSMENLNQRSLSRESLKLPKKKSLLKDLARNVLLPCDNGESYSVSPNQIMHIPNEQSLASVKDRVHELESKKSEKKKLVLNLMPQFEKTNSEVDSSSNSEAQTKLTTPNKSQVLTKTETCEVGVKNGTINDCDLKCSASDEQTIKTVGSTVPEVRLRSKTLRKEVDPFSNQLDRVFDREERKQQRVTMVPADMETESSSTNDEPPRDCPSRQSSWSSYDSAVVLGYQGETREAPSRHSSWGSGDTRTLPSRNSSWGSYDMRPGNGNDLIENSSSGIFPYDKEDIPWYPGTVKRTKQRLEESTSKQTDDKLKSSNETLQEFPIEGGTVEAFNPVLIGNDQYKSSSSSNVNILSAITPNVEKDLSSRLSVSAPESSTMELITQECSLSRSASNIGKIDSPNIISTAQCSSVKQHKLFLENLSKDVNKKEEIFELETNSGLVKNLKKEFEAKNNVDRVNQMNLNNSDMFSEKKVNSLPSSPISLQNEKNIPTPAASDPEDLNFRELIGKFEKHDGDVTLRPKTKQSFKNSRYSCIEVSVEKSPIRIKQTVSRNNTTPNVVVTTVIAKATKKQQQYGKSHPLARLNIKPRHNNPVYNTM